MKKPLGAADERIIAFKEAKQLMGCARDANAHAFADGAHGMVCFAKPQRSWAAEIDAVVTAIDLQRLREASRAAREVQKLRGFAVALHDFDAFERLERANQNGSGGFWRLAHHVEHKMRAIIEKYIDVAGSQI